jgi:hypothetical protein
MLVGETRWSYNAAVEAVLQPFTARGDVSTESRRFISPNSNYTVRMLYDTLSVAVTVIRDSIK